MGCFFTTLYCIHRTLAQEVDVFARDLDSEVPLHLDISRSYVLFDAMREAKKKRFTTTKMVQVLMPTHDIQHQCLCVYVI